MKKNFLCYLMKYLISIVCVIILTACIMKGPLCVNKDIGGDKLLVILVSWSLTFLEVVCAENFLI